MKQQYSMLTWLLFFVLSTTMCVAQRTISGTVSDSQGQGMPGVNVVVKGTSAGTTSDADGKYTLSVPDAGSNVLVFSFIGYATQEVDAGTRTTVDVTLAEDVRELTEVVVTALGIERSTKALSSSITNVSGENFTKARENNLGNSLQGRVAGVNVSKVASGAAGSSRVIIRGNKTLGGQGQPLYVVDGVPMDNGQSANSLYGSSNGQAGLWGGQDNGDALSSINPDDIESITVLKGANAAALYGSRGGNGVINITTKRGRARQGIGVEFSSNYVAETVMKLADLQEKYGAGVYQSGVASKPTTVREAFNWGEQSWGPALDGSETIGIDGVARPYSYAGDNWDRFYQTGSAWTNSLALTGGGEKQTFRFGVSDLRSKSIVPNSGYDRLNLSFTTNAKLGNKLTLDGKVIYSYEYAKNRPTISDSPGNAIQAIWRRPPNINVDDLKGDPNKLGAIPTGVDPDILSVYGQDGDPKFAGQELLPAANNWGQNPWWAAWQHNNSDKRDRIITSAQLRYDITSWLYASGRIGMDYYTRRTKNLTPEGVGYQLGGALNEGEDRVREVNMDWMLGADKAFDKFNVNAFIGGNKMVRSAERLQLNGNGFNVPFQPFINNASQRNYTYGYNSSQINSLFYSAEISYNNVLFLTTTGRQDWFSVLNPEFKNDVFYPSVGASFVFSDAFSALPLWLSFGKVRASWAQVGLANIGPYDVNVTYSLNGNSHPSMGPDGTVVPHTMATFSSADNNNGNIPNPQLVPAVSEEIELGFDTRFFDNRLGIDFTYYSQKTTKDIVRATISRSSGFGTTDINVGELQNRGVEILLTGTPIQGDFNWDVSLNVAKNENKVVSILPGVPELTLEEPRTRNVFIKHIVGQPFGTITGRVQQRDANGNLIFEEDGRAVASADYVPIGNGLPDWTGGLNNAFTYKGINLSFLIDFKFGGDIFSGTNNRLTQWGLHQQSLIGREGETPLHVTGVIKDTETPIDRDLTPNEAQIYWDNVGGESTAISEMFLYDASFVKLRQLTLGYTFPRAMLNKTPFQTLSISFVGRNLAILYKDIENVDPESNYSANAGAQGLEYFGFPSTRSYGFNLSVTF
ncbi:MAG TPA: SusC/RagA family TonB-linked outer membrane protein [Chryseolinea sp.]|nr:SusC/RagA family TonB-linked outer membrane protein [Chryseolinea sp.]